MSALDLAVAQLKPDEGFRSKVYKDIVGKQTIGYGFNIDAGITVQAASALLTAQANDVQQDLAVLDWFRGLDDVRASVCIQLGFNLGLNGLLAFQKMIDALRSGNWQGAHDELLASHAAYQLPARYGRLANLLLNGVQT
jgi:lysozyme